MNEITMVSLSTLARGAAIERFDAVLSQVARNIQDPNTPALSGREIILKVKFKPTEDRAAAMLTIDCTAKLAGMAPYPTLVYLGKDRDGHAFASEYDPRQMNLDLDNPTITQFPERKTASD
jgi:hypothetical protein